MVLENVPGLREEPRFRRLLREIADGYHIREYIAQAADFGVPQNRRRMIVLCVERAVGVELSENLLDALPDVFDTHARTAGDAVAMAGGVSAEEDPIHRARSPRPKTLQRIMAVKPGGDGSSSPPICDSSATRA